MSVHQTTIDDLMAEIDRIDAEEVAVEAKYEAMKANDIAQLAAARHAVQLTLQRFMAQTIERPESDDMADVPPLLIEPDSPVVEAPHSMESRPDQQALPLPTQIAWARKLSGLSQPQALVVIAKTKGGVIRVADAKDILFQAHLAKASPNNLRSHIHRLLMNSEQFEKTGRGEFRLVRAK